jgi:hypothetical protein
MCAIVGALLRNDISRSDVLDANYRLNHIFRKSMERGRDGRGWYSRAMHYAAHTVDATRIPGRDEFWGDDVKFFEQGDMPLHLIGNLRAEPTTEFVRDKMTGPVRSFTTVPSLTTRTCAPTRSSRKLTALQSSSTLQRTKRVACQLTD